MLHKAVDRIANSDVSDQTSLVWSGSALLWQTSPSENRIIMIQYFPRSNDIDLI